MNPSSQLAVAYYVGAIWFSWLEGLAVKKQKTFSIYNFESSKNCDLQRKITINCDFLAL